MLLLSVALAAPPDPLFDAVLPWSALPLRAAVPESPAIGPDWFVVGPDGPILFDAADRRVYAARIGAQGGLPVALAGLPAADDGLILTDGSLLLRDDRTVWRVRGAGSASGAEVVQTATLPDLAPPGPLRQIGDRIYTVDVFSNLHPAFVLDGALRPATDPALLANPRPVRREGRTLTVGGIGGKGGQTQVACAMDCGGWMLGDWLIVEEHGGNTGGNTGGALAAMLTVRRYAVHTGSGRRVELGPDGARLYAPSGDLSVDTEGDLWWMTPEAAGLRLVEVRP